MYGINAKRIRDQHVVCKVTNASSQTGNNESNFYCKIYKKMYYSTDLNHHLLQHGDDKLLCCKKCDKVFHCKEKLRIHTRTHYDFQDREYVCYYCEDTFLDNIDLKEHLNEHLNNAHNIHSGHKRVVRAVRCPSCSILLKDKSTLKSHMLQHTEERGYRCDICHEKFKYRSLLDEHFNQHKCLYCDIVFINTLNLLSHMQSLHKDKPNYSDNIQKLPRGNEEKLSQNVHQNPVRTYGRSKRNVKQHPDFEVDPVVKEEIVLPKQEQTIEKKQQIVVFPKQLRTYGGRKFMRPKPVAEDDNISIDPTIKIKEEIEEFEDNNGLESLETVFEFSDTIKTEEDMDYIKIEK